MIVLTILREDESVYWVEYFSTMEAAQVWIEEEQTRPYWNPTYTYNFVDNTRTFEPRDET